jgi:uncharacterized protein (TIGR02444 family)
MIIGADSTGVTDSNPFWTFSLALYSEPGVADACIELQDTRGIDVNLLLYACFASACNVALTSRDVSAVQAAAGVWREDFVRPIRTLRRRSEGELRTKLLEAEVLAEARQQQAMWKGRSPRGGWPGKPDAGNAAALLASNLAAVADGCGIARRRLSSFEALVEPLLPGLVANR